MDNFKETIERFYGLFACDHAFTIIQLVRKDGQLMLDPELIKRIETFNDYPNARCEPPEKFREILSSEDGLNPKIQEAIVDYEYFLQHKRLRRADSLKWW